MIKGLSEKRRMPRAGKIRLGITVQGRGGKSYPKATDYFVCPPEVLKVLDQEQPKELPLMFPVDDADQIFPQSLKMYRQAGLWCAGDGERARRWDESGNLKERECPCEYLEQGQCKPTATLNFILPDVPGIGVWQITTSNKASIESINTALETFRATFGGLRGVPFLLKLEPYQTERWDEDRKGMVKTEIYTLRLDSPYSFRQILEWRKELGTGGLLALMPAPEDEDLSARQIEGAAPVEAPQAPPVDPPPPAPDAPPEKPNPDPRPRTENGRPIDPETGEVLPEVLPGVADPTPFEACLVLAARLGLKPLDYRICLAQKYSECAERAEMITGAHASSEHDFILAALEGGPVTKETALATYRALYRKSKSSIPHAPGKKS